MLDLPLFSAGGGQGNRDDQNQARRTSCKREDVVLATAVAGDTADMDE